MQHFLNTIENGSYEDIKKLRHKNPRKFPEWKKMRHRRQNRRFSIQEHTLKMFRYILKNKRGKSNYKRLNSYSKKILRLSILLHDADKKRGGDKGHAYKCSINARKRLTDWDYEKDITNIVVFFVKYHSRLIGIGRGGDKGFKKSDRLLNDLIKISDKNSIEENIDVLKILTQADLYGQGHYSKTLKRGVFSPIGKRGRHKLGNVVSEAASHVKRRYRSDLR